MLSAIRAALDISATSEVAETTPVRFPVEAVALGARLTLYASDGIA